MRSSRCPALESLCIAREALSNEAPVRTVSSPSQSILTAHPQLAELHKPEWAQAFAQHAHLKSLTMNFDADADYSSLDWEPILTTENLDTWSLYCSALQEVHLNFLIGPLWHKEKRSEVWRDGGMGWQVEMIEGGLVVSGFSR